MKKPYIEVVVNSGENEGKKGIVTGWDRNKYYLVEFEDGDFDLLKGYYLNGINSVPFKKHYLLDGCTGYSCDWDDEDDKAMTNKELWADYKLHNRYPSSLSKKEVTFDMYCWKDKSSNKDLRFRFSTLDELKRKIRYAIQNKMSFEVNVQHYKRSGFNWGETLVSLDFNNYSFWFGEFREKEEQKYFSKRYHRTLKKFIEGL